MPETILITGSCLEHLADVGDNTIDAIVTDPPYGLSKEPDICEVLKHWLAGDVYEHKGGGFMGKSWDSFVPGPEYWREFYRVLKPGGHILVFGGTRTVDLLTIAIRLGGFEIRDQLAWLYGTGFPKSLDVSKAIDKAGEADEAARRFSGFGTALKPAQEPIVLARKPLIGTVAANVLEHGTGALNIDGCRIGSEGGGTSCTNRDESGKCLGHKNAGRSTSGETFHGPDSDGGRWPANVLFDEAAAAVLDEQTQHLHGAGKARTGETAKVADSYDASSYQLGPHRNMRRLGDSGGASRFFYIAKPGRKERDAGVSAPPSTGGEATDRVDGSDGLNSPRAGAGRTGGARNRHPTVKPIELMRYLIRLVTPPDGLVMDPFMGSGTTGCAAVLEGVHFLGFDLDPEYVQLAEERIAHWRADADASEPDEDAA